MKMPLRSSQQLLASTLIAFFFFGLQGLGATIMKPYLLAELKAKASHIALIEINRCQGAWQNNRIVTTCDFQVIQAYQSPGKADDTIKINRLSYFGGEVNGLAQRISGAPSLKVGDQVLAFLSCIQECQIVGFSQGLWYPEQKIKADDSIENMLFSPKLEGISFSKHAGFDQQSFTQKQRIADLLKSK